MDWTWTRGLPEVLSKSDRYCFMPFYSEMQYPGSTKSMNVGFNDPVQLATQITSQYF
jgi:hypothetical protein